MVEREITTMIVDMLPVFYYKKLVGYMPSSFADLVFSGKRIEVGLKRGKFDYVTPAGTINRRFRASGAKKKEGDAHAVTLAPTWPKPQQTLNNTYQNAQHQPSFSAHVGNPSNPKLSQQGAPAQPQRAPAQNPATTQPRLAGISNPPVKKLLEFALILLSYTDLLPSLIANQMAMVTLRRIYQSHFPRCYNPNATYAYLAGTPGHSIE